MKHTNNQVTLPRQIGSSTVWSTSNTYRTALGEFLSVVLLDTTRLFKIRLVQIEIQLRPPDRNNKPIFRLPRDIHLAPQHRRNPLSVRLRQSSNCS
jgi:hypothetical protein